MQKTKLTTTTTTTTKKKHFLKQEKIIIDYINNNINFEIMQKKFNLNNYYEGSINNNTDRDVRDFSQNWV